MYTLVQPTIQRVWLAPKDITTPARPPGAPGEQDQGGDASGSASLKFLLAARYDFFRQACTPRLLFDLIPYEVHCDRGYDLTAELCHPSS